MAISAVYEIDGVTISTSEISIVSGTTTLQTITDDGIYQVWVDFSAMAKGDEFIFKFYEKVEATGGTKRVLFEQSFLGAQSNIFVTPTLICLNGWDATLTKLAGTDRALDAEIRKVA